MALLGGKRGRGAALAVLANNTCRGQSGGFCRDGSLCESGLLTGGGISVSGCRGGRCVGTRSR